MHCACSIDGNLNFSALEQDCLSYFLFYFKALFVNSLPVFAVSTHLVVCCHFSTCTCVFPDTVACCLMVLFPVTSCSALFHHVNSGKWVIPGQMFILPFTSCNNSLLLNCFPPLTVKIAKLQKYSILTSVLSINSADLACSNP